MFTQNTFTKLPPATLVPFLGYVLCSGLLLTYGLRAQTFEGVLVDLSGGTFSMGEPETAYQGPPGSYDAPEHSVTLSPFSMSQTEITNQQYVTFLNAALADGLADGLIEVRTETSFLPDIGNRLVYGTSAAPTVYAGQALLNLSGTRTMKDHDNGDGDNDPFTGVIEPENPLNLTYIGYDTSRPSGQHFYVKDPRDADDFDWQTLTDYYNYTTVSRQEDTSVQLNDFAAWPELADYPNNLPTQDEVANWPATFIRWYGAKAFARYYGLDLPTEAEWEYAAQGGGAFAYATADGTVAGDGTRANWNHLLATPSLGHVEDVYRGAPNPYGLYNLAGNVWEWVDDWYASDAYTDGATDPVYTTDTGVKVRRGGSWNYHESTLKSAARAKDEQFKGNDHFGFRVVSRTSTSTSSEHHETLPVQPYLAQNYPNPFNPTTTIAFGLSRTETVRLRVFDSLGRERAVLVDGPLSPGLHRLSFDASALPNGLYIYRLETPTTHLTRTMMLLK